MKRLLAFLLLVALGAFVLQLAIGDEPLAKGAAPAAPDAAPQQPVESGVVPVRQGATEIGVAVSGALELRAPGRRTKVGDRTIEHHAYELKCRDSRPIGDGRQQLDDVDVRIFDRGMPAARLQASSAFVELGRDQNGSPSLRQDKRAQLRGAVLSSLPDAGMLPFRLEGGQVFVQLADDVIVLESENDDDPVALVLGGERPASMRGRGLQARLPKDVDGAVGRVEIAIVREPVIETQGIAVRAAGRLQYVEQVRSGTALVTVERDVRVTLADAAMTSGARGEATVTGDHLSGWLLRERLRGAGADARTRESATWRLLRIEGQPVQVTGPGLDVTTQRLTVVPGASGQPWLFTAGGTRNQLTQTDGRTGRSATFSTTRRLHLVRPGERIGAVYRQFGFPLLALRPLYDMQIAVFAGQTTADTGDGATMTASRGLLLYRPGGDSEAIVAHGLGDVRIEQHGKPGSEPVVVIGNDGFVLRRGPLGESLQLGPADVAAPTAMAHAYDLQRGGLRIQGKGSCGLRRGAEGRTVVTLASPEPTITVVAADEPIRLSEADRLHVELVDDRIVELDAHGLPLHVDGRDGRQTVAATAPVVRKVGPHEWLLSMVDDDGRTARLDPEQITPRIHYERSDAAGNVTERLDLDAPAFLISALGHERAAVTAMGERHLPVSVRGAVRRQGTDQPTLVAATANRVRVLPFAVPPLALAMHGAGLPAGLREVVHRSAVAPWLLADDVASLEVNDPEHGRIRGHGKRLVLAHGADAGMVIGDPLGLTPAEVRRGGDGEREVIARGARVRFFRAAADGLAVLATFADRSVLLAPEVELRSAAGKSGVLTDLRATCRGDVEVRPESVVFAGPVRAQSLLADGAEDPDGLVITTKQLGLTRDADGQVTRIEASGDVVLEWSRIRARCRQLDVDLPWQRCIVRDPDGAEVWLPDGQYFRSPHLEANYRTLSVDSYGGRFEQRPPVGGGQR